MSIVGLRKFIVFMITLSVLATVCEAQSSRSSGNGLFGKSRNGKNEMKVKRPLKAGKAKKKQEANQKRLKKDYGLFLANSRKRSIAIQTPEVQSRMKQNRKNSDTNYKLKKKNIAASSKSAGRKYKK